METRHCLFSRFHDTHGIDFSRRKGKIRPPMIPQGPTEQEPIENI